MPSKHYTIWLNESTYIVVDFESVQGEITSFVVRLGHIRDGLDRDVARYDTSHGRPHRDVVLPAGRLWQKTWMGESEFDNAMTLAINDFKRNHEEYCLAQIEKRLPRV